MQLLERVAQSLVLARLHRVKPGEHLGLHFLEAGQRRARRLVGMRERVADLGRAQLLMPAVT